VTDYDELRKQIAGALSVAECQRLAEVAAATTTTSALEVGHYYGLSTAVLLGALPPGCELVTIDHHRGDPWAGAVPASAFEQNVDPFVGDRRFRSINADMLDVIPDLTESFGFVFYDADHRADAVAAFWAAVRDKLDRHCILVFDDADWEEQSTLRTLAEADGFVVVTDRPFHRGGDDKHDPLTYTLEVMHRA
jgi:predicted O-methyltransferase YrrM